MLILRDRASACFPVQQSSFQALIACQRDGETLAVLKRTVGFPNILVSTIEIEPEIVRAALGFFGQLLENPSETSPPNDVTKPQLSTFVLMNILVVTIPLEICLIIFQNFFEFSILLGNPSYLLVTFKIIQSSPKSENL
jgi:hypothetical protein